MAKTVSTVKISKALKALNGGATIKQVAKRYGVTAQTVSNWKKKYTTATTVPRGTDVRNTVATKGTTIQSTMDRKTLVRAVNALTNQIRTLELENKGLRQIIDGFNTVEQARSNNKGTTVGITKH